MKKLGIIISAALAALLASCSDDAISPEQGVDSVQPAPELVPLSISTGTQTKTVLSGTTVNWTADDQIAVFDDLHCLNCFDAVSVSGSSAVFEGKVAAKTTDFYAVYPYTSAIRADEDNIYVNLPMVQEPLAGSFAEEHNVSIAHGTKAVGDDDVDGVVFENKCALLKFKIPSVFADVAEASFIAENRALVGNMVYSKGWDCFIGTTSGNSKVSLKGQMKGGQTYYFVVSPGQVRGFRLTVKDNSGVEMTNSSPKSFETKAGVITDLGEVKIVINPSLRFDGTDVWFDIGLPKDVEKHVDSVEGWLSPDGHISSARRIISMNSENANVRFPYLTIVFPGRNEIPPGNYILHLNYVIKGLGRFEEDHPVVVPAR